MKLSERQEKILLSLKKLDFLNRDQLAKIHRLGKVRNTNRILKELSPYLSSFREEYSTIYYLNKEGRAYVNSQKIRKKNSLVNHVIMRNDFYIYSGYPHQWENEIRVKDDDYTIICDAYFKRNGRYHFLEVDSLQKMSENKKKVERYVGLMKNGAVEKQLGYFPQLLWLTTTELRRKQLMDLCKNIPNAAIFTLDDIR
jgi:hypothetical protein